MNPQKLFLHLKWTHIDPAKKHILRILTSGKVDLASLKMLEGSVVGSPAYLSFHKVNQSITQHLNYIVCFIFDNLISLKGELLVGCGDGEVVMVAEGALKKPPPGRVTFPTQVRRKLLTDNQW